MNKPRYYYRLIGGVQISVRNEGALVVLKIDDNEHAMSAVTAKEFVSEFAAAVAEAEKGGDLEYWRKTGQFPPGESKA